MKKENDVLVAREQDIITAVHYECNPLMRIHLGMRQEVYEVRNLAKKIVPPMMYRPEVVETAVELIASVSLHCLYAHYADPENYPIFPTLLTISNFLKGSIIAEEAIDENGSPIYDEETGDVKKQVYEKGFLDTVSHLLYFQHVPRGGIDIKEWNIGLKSHNIRPYFHKWLREDYPEYLDILDVNPYVHPWIHRSFMHFISCKKSSVFKEALVIAPLAIENYVDKHHKCTERYIQDEIKEKSKFPFEQNREINPFANDEEVIKIEKEKKGRRLKPVKEIIKDIIKQVF